MSSRFTHLVTNERISFFFKVEYYTIVYTDHISFTHSFVNGRLGWFHILAIVNGSMTWEFRCLFVT